MVILIQQKPSVAMHNTYDFYSDGVDDFGHC